ncbi:hypothetical protein [Kribbella sp. NPDC055071]
MGQETACESCGVRQQILAILSSDRPPAEKVRAVELAANPPPPPEPIEVTDRGWPVLGTAWERHDDLEYR